MTASVYAREYADHLTNVLSPIVGVGGQLFRTGEIWESLWVPFRPALRAWRVSQVNQRYLARQLRTTRLDWWLYPSVPYPVMLVSLRFVEAHVLGFALHPACVAYTVWRSHVWAALMRYGIYNPATNHEPEPGEELDALERREHLQAMFDQCFPWFRTLKRYRIVADEHGQKYAEEISPDTEDPDDDAQS